MTISRRMIVYFAVCGVIGFVLGFTGNLIDNHFQIETYLIGLTMGFWGGVMAYAYA